MYLHIYVCIYIIKIVKFKIFLKIHFLKYICYT